jgi:hypothetical protein
LVIIWDLIIEFWDLSTNVSEERTCLAAEKEKEEKLRRIRGKRCVVNSDTLRREIGVENSFSVVKSIGKLFYHALFG